MVCRPIVLRYSDNPDEQEKGFVGNTILLAKPKPEEIMRALPPSEADISQYVFACPNQVSESVDRGARGVHPMRSPPPASLPRVR